MMTFSLQYLILAALMPTCRPCQWPTSVGPQGILLPDIDVLVDVDGERVAAFVGKVADFGPCVSTEVSPLPLRLAIAKSGAGNPGENTDIDCYGQVITQAVLVQDLSTISLKAAALYETMIRRVLRLW